MKLEGRDYDVVVGTLAIVGGVLVAATPAVAYVVAYASSLTPGGLAALFLPYCLGGIVWLLLGLIGIQAGLRARKGREFSGGWLIVTGVLAIAASALWYGVYGVPGAVGGAMLVASGAFPVAPLRGARRT